MAREKQPEPPGDDIPAWFMTFSDVITLLMTFFILLLTFSTTEPERFEKVQVSAFGQSSATGIVGHPHEDIERKSWVQRVRPHAARISMTGSEMPPMVDEPSSASVGRGLEAANDEESEKDVMTSNSFEILIESLVTDDLRLTPKGVEVARMVAAQLRKLPVHCAIEFSSPEVSARATTLLSHLYDVEHVRPGQVAASYAVGVNDNKVKFLMQRFEE
ncbi:MAG: flagellar motor protein MotB [Planctomycetota bacterium]